MAHHVKSVEDFQNQLKTAGSKLVLVDFYAEWCGPCKRIAPAIEQIGKAGEIVVLKVDVEEVDALALQYDVSAMPTFMFFKNGSKIAGADIVGASIDKIQSTIAAHK